MEALARDTRHTLRRLGRDRRFSAAAVTLLGLGIGANTAAFSLVNAALLRGHAHAGGQGLVEVYQKGSNPGGIDACTYPVYLDVAAHTDLFESTTAVLVPHGVGYLDRGVLRPAVVEHTTASYPMVLGLRPSLGRWFTAEEDRPGAVPVAVLGYVAWREKFRADPSVIGRRLQIEGVPVTIVGVGPRGHRGTIDLGILTDFWLPVSSLPALGGPPRALERSADEAAFLVRARLRPGVSVAQARAAMDLLASRLAADYPELPGRGIALLPSADVRVHPQLDGALEATAALLLGVVGLVLAVAWSNLATLLLVRGTARAKEVSLRLALGATRGQIVRQLLTESLLLSVAGCIAGCALAWWAVRALAALELPFVIDLSLDLRVLGSAAALSLVTGIAFGLAPALTAARVDLVPALRGEGEARPRGPRRLTPTNAFVALQVAVSFALLGATSVTLQALDASRARPSGFTVEGVATIEVGARYAGRSDAEARRALEELQRRVAAIPGVQSSVLGHGLPMATTGLRVVAEGAAVPAGATDVAAPAAGAIWAAPGYFDLLRIPILFGRPLDEGDGPDAPRVAVISETMARQCFGTTSAAGAIGRRFRLEREAGASGWIEVVGVVRDTGTSDLQGDLTDPMPWLVYRPIAQWDEPPTTLVARTRLDAAGLVGAMRRELRAVDAGLPVLSAETLASRLERSLAAPKAVAAVFGALGILGLLLAAVGVHAVVAFAVSRRSREIGIRTALGARSWQVVFEVVRGAALPVAVGSSAGLASTLLLVVGLRSVSAPAAGLSLYRPSTDLTALAAITAVMALASGAAAFGPARRAARMDPATVLRHD